MVKAHQFFAEESWVSFKQVVEAYMFEAWQEWVEANEEGSLLDTLYKARDEVMQQSECDIYSYNSDCDADPFLEKGSINVLAEGSLSNGLYCENDEIFDVMDMELFDDMDM